jgi:hypothetical protein
MERVQSIAGTSCRSPLATMRSASSGNGLCSLRASAVASAESQRSISPASVRTTGMAFGWIGATIALASVVRNPKSSCSPSIGALLGPRTPLQGVQRPAKAKSGRSSLSANQIGVLRGLVSAYSQKEVAGTTQRLRGIASGKFALANVEIGASTWSLLPRKPFVLANSAVRTKARLACAAVRVWPETYS